MLAVSGKLDLTMGGPGFRRSSSRTTTRRTTTTTSTTPTTRGRTAARVYRFIVRSVPDPFMDALDCADPSLIVPVRNETLTAAAGAGAAQQPVHGAAWPSTSPRARAGSRDPPTHGRRRLPAGPGPRARPTTERASGRLRAEHGLANACR